MVSSSCFLSGGQDVVAWERGRGRGNGEGNYRACELEAILLSEPSVKEEETGA